MPWWLIDWDAELFGAEAVSCSVGAGLQSVYSHVPLLPG
jgi:hypothetical protein